MIWPARVTSVNPMIAARDVPLMSLHQETDCGRHGDLEGLRQDHIAHPGDVVQAERLGGLRTARAESTRSQPRQISPRKALVLSDQRNAGGHPGD